MIEALDNLNDREVLGRRKDTAEELFAAASRQPPEKLWRARVLRVVGAARSSPGEVPSGLERGFDAAELVIRPDAVAALAALGPLRLDAWAEHELEPHAADRDYDAPARREGLLTLLSRGAPLGPRVLERLFDLRAMTTREEARELAACFRRSFESSARTRWAGWLAEQAEGWASIDLRTTASASAARAARLALVAVAAGAQTRWLPSRLDRFVRLEDASHYLERRDLKALLERLPLARADAVLERASARLETRLDLLLYLRPDLPDAAMTRAAALVIDAREDDALYALHRKLGGGSPVLRDAGPRLGPFLKSALRGAALSEMARERLESQLDPDAYRALVEREPESSERLGNRPVL